MFKKLMRRLDQFINTATGTGDGKAWNTYYQSLGGFVNSTTLTNMYQNEWLARKIVDLPAIDALSVELEFASDEPLDAFLEEVERLKLMDKVLLAVITARLYGGAAIIIGPDESAASMPNSELIPENVKGIKTLNVVDGYELQPLDWNSDVFTEGFGMPETWMYNPQPGGGATPGAGTVVHNSRVLIFKGDYVPKKGFQGNSEMVWPYGQSVIQSNFTSIRDYEILEDAATEIAQAFSIKTLKILNLMDLLSDDDGDAMLQTRASVVNTQLSAHKTLVIDTEEALEFRNPNISGFDKLYDGVIDQVCGSSCIPRQRLFTQQLGTLAGAEETTKAYYDYLGRIQHSVEENVDIALKLIAAIVGLNDFTWKFSDLTKPDEKTIAETRKIVAETDQIYIQNQVLTPEEIEQSRFGDGYSMETQLLEGEAGDASMEEVEFEEE